MLRAGYMRVKCVIEYERQGEWCTEWYQREGFVQAIAIGPRPR